MKKIFTLMVMCVLAIAAQAKITIYVQSETAPFLWTWGAVGGTFDNVGDWPGTLQMTEKFTHPDTGETFWMYSFPDEITSINFLFNNGDADNTRQSEDINGVTSDRYFILGAWPEENVKITPQDITEDYIEVPDAEITSCGISGNHNGWGLPEGSDLTIVEAGKKYSFTATAEEIGVAEWEFKFRPNELWLGYGDFAFDGDAPEWLTDKGGNFFVNFTESNIKSVTFTLTWGGGKDASKNWTLKAEAEFNEGEAPDAEITSCGISGNHNGWELPEGSDLTVVEAGKKYSFTATAEEIGVAEWEFKFRPNELWLGYGEFSYDPEAPEWLTDKGGNFCVNFTESNIESVTFTLTWGGGKSASKNWTLKAEATFSTGIKSVKNNTKNAVMYNLQGQSVQEGLLGIVIMNGRKVVIK
jgi:hypothetical protein